LVYYAAHHHHEKPEPSSQKGTVKKELNTSKIRYLPPPHSSPAHYPAYYSLLHSKLRFFPAPLHIIHIEPEGEKRVQNEWMNITKRWSGPPTERPGPVTFFTQKSRGKKAKEHVNGRIERGTKK